MNTRPVIIAIDTTAIRTASVGLVVEGREIDRQTVEDHGAGQPLLPLIEAMLTRHTLTLRDVTGVTVAIGPGSFTGIRVGIAVANALSVLLGVPVNGKESLAVPAYS